jgi:hypothetical protein
MRFAPISSGFGFSCGILRNNQEVRCWGNNTLLANQTQREFRNMSMTSIVARGLHVCGFNSTRLWFAKETTIMSSWMFLLRIWRESSRLWRFGRAILVRLDEWLGWWCVGVAAESIRWMWHKWFHLKQLCRDWILFVD